MKARIQSSFARARQLLSQKSFKLSAVAAATLVSAVIPTQASAHGYVDFPKARQAICNADAGYWWPADGSAIPNAACRNAFLDAGHYQFVQDIEFAKLVSEPGYLDQSLVEAAVTDGLLCAGGDTKKKGMDLPHPDWQTTEINLDENGQFLMSFNAATPHNPSFWKFYLTKPGFNPATDVLSWADLDLVDEVDDLAIVMVNDKPYYQYDVSLPTDRSGRAILYTRWQRIDAAGEGFYNCSDIIIGGDVTPPAWNDKGGYVNTAYAPEVGDEVWFRLFDNLGNETVFEKLTITSANTAIDVWASDLAAQVNAVSTAVQVGELQADDSVTYNTTDTFANKVFVKDAINTFRVDIKKPAANQAPVITTAPADINVQATASGSLSVAATDADNDPLTYSWTAPAALNATGTDTTSISFTAPAVTVDTDYTVSVAVSDGTDTTTSSATVTVKAPSVGGCNQVDPNAGNYPAWVNGTVYNSGDQVSNNDLVWQAKYWVNNQEPTASAGAWTLLSDVPNVWSSATAYSANSEVHHNGRKWKNDWWISGAEPGVDSVWKDQGVSDCQ